MRVILREDVRGLGRGGEVVKVADGYARNYLLPRALAIPASEKNERVLAHEKAVIERRLAKIRTDAESVAKRIAGVTVTIEVRVGDQDRLFGSVTTRDLEEKLAEQGITLDRRHIALAEPIKTLGSFDVPVELSGAITTSFTVNVVKQP